MSSGFMEENEKSIEELKSGNRAAFENMFHRWKDPVYGYVLKMVRDYSTAQDITQEVFLRVMKAVHSYNHRGRFRQWLFTIASNLVMDHARKTKRRREVSADDSDISDRTATDTLTALPAGSLSESELRESLLHAVESLPQEQRSVLLLRQYAGLSFKEIAVLDDCSINTALSRMRYALTNMRKLVSNYFEEAQKNEVR